MNWWQIIFDAAPYSLVLLETRYDPTGAVEDFKILLVNAFTEQITGLTNTDLIGQRYSQIFPAAQVPGVLARLQAVATTGESADFEQWYDGEGRRRCLRFIVVQQNEWLVVTTEEITARKEAEQAAIRAARLQADAALQASEARLTAILEEIPAAVYLKSPAGALLFANRTARAIAGAEGAYQGKQETELAPAAPAELFERIRQQDQAVLHSPTPLAFEETMPHPDGTQHDYLSTKFALRQQGEPYALVGISLDITERKRTEEALRASEERLRMLFDTMSQGVAIMELVRNDAGTVVDCRYLEFNPAFDALTGFDRNAVAGRRVSEVFPQHFLSFQPRLETVEGPAGPERFEACIPETGRWFSFYAAPFGGRDGFVVFFNDITERKLEERRREFILKLSDALRPLSDPLEIQRTATKLLSDHFDTARSYYMEIDDENHVATMRAETLRADVPSNIGVYDLRLFEEVISPLRSGKPLVINHWDDKVKDEMKIRGNGKEVMTERQVVSQISVPVIKDGKLIATFTVMDNRPRNWTEHEVTLMFETAERTWAAVVRAKAEEALRDSESRLHSIANLVPDLLWDSEPDGSTNWYNRRWLEYTGQSFEEAIGWGWADAIHPDDREASARRYREAVENGELLRQEHRIRRHDGEYRWFIVNAFPLKDESGRIIKMYGAATDIHELRIMHEALRESEEKYRTLFNSIDEGYCRIKLIFDDDGNAVDWIFLEINPAFEQMQGFNPVGEKISSLMPDIERFWFDFYAEVAKTGLPARTENYVEAIHSWRSVFASRVQETTDELVVVFNDITERKLEERRREFLLKFNDALRQITDPLLIQAAATRLLGEHLAADRTYYGEINHAREVFTVERDYVRGDAPTVAGEHPFPAFAPLLDAYGKGLPFVVEDATTDPRINDVDRAAYAQISLRSFLSVPRLRDGAAVAGLAVANVTARRWTDEDIAIVREVAERTWDAVERARAEEALRASQERYRLLFESMDEGFILVDVLFDDAGRAVDIAYLEANPAAHWMTGKPKLVGLRMSEVEPGFDPAWATPYGQVARSGEPLRLEYFAPMPVAPGAAPVDRWFDFRMARVGGDDSRRVAVVFQNVTERKRAEEALRSSEERFRMVANLVPDLLWSNDPAGMTDWYNQRWLEYTGQTFAEAIDYGWLDAVHPDDRATALHNFQAAVMQGEPLRQEQRIGGVDGAFRWFLVQARPLRDAAGHIVRWFGAATDIHEQRIARDLLEQRVAERTHELATVSAMRQSLLDRLITAQEDERRRLAHDLHDSLGQYLVALNVGLKTVQAIEGCPPAATSGISALRTMVVRMDEEVERLAFALRPLALDDLGLADALRQHVDLWADDSHIAVDVHLRGVAEERLPDVVETAIFRIVQEALTNIRKYAAATHVSLLLEQRPQEVRVIIEDNGQGFDPTVVLAERGARLQLGISGMRERAVLVGGALEIESAPGAGTTLYVRIPLSRKEDAEQS